MRTIILVVVVIVLFTGVAFSEGMWCFFPSEDLNIYKEPSTNSQIVGVFKRQVVVMRSIGKYRGWIRLNTGAGSEIGWIERKGIIEYCSTMQEAEEKFSRYKETGNLDQTPEPEKPQVEEVIKPDTQPVSETRETYDYGKKAEEIAKIIGSFLIVIVLGVIYFLPSIIGRHKKNATAIGVLNILLGLFLFGTSIAILFFLPSIVGGIAVFILFGSTVLGWIVALVWACCKD
jgi:hypothetical protein